MRISRGGGEYNETIRGIFWNIRNNLNGSPKKITDRLQILRSLEYFFIDISTFFSNTAEYFKIFPEKSRHPFPPFKRSLFGKFSTKGYINVQVNVRVLWFIIPKFYTFLIYLRVASGLAGGFRTTVGAAAKKGPNQVISCVTNYVWWSLQ